MGTKKLNFARQLSLTIIIPEYNFIYDRRHVDSSRYRMCSITMQLHSNFFVDHSSGFNDDGFNFFSASSWKNRCEIIETYLEKLIDRKFPKNTLFKKCWGRLLGGGVQLAFHHCHTFFHHDTWNNSGITE